MKISFRNKKEIKHKQTASFFSFKIIHRSIWAAFWGLSFFVSPWFLLALIPFVIVVLSGAIEWDSFNFLQWKRTKNGKADRYLTYRKLMYLIEMCEKGNISNAYYKKTLCNFFSYGRFYINQNIQITLDEIGFFKPLKATIFYKGEEIDSVCGYSFQKLKFDLNDFPHIMEEVQNFFIECERKFQNSKQLTTQQEIKRKERLAQQVRNDYNQM